MYNHSKKNKLILHETVKSIRNKQHLVCREILLVNAAELAQIVKK